MEKLDAICMQLIAIGEGLQNVDKITNNYLLHQYPEIKRIWSGPVTRYLIEKRVTKQGHPSNTFYWHAQPDSFDKLRINSNPPTADFADAQPAT